MKPVAAEVFFPKVEESIIKYWKENKIFQKSMDPCAPTVLGEKPKAPRPEYLFYDGPPFATGLPHYGHLLAGTIKDVVGRFYTMKGYHVDRRFGWDCHGMPVEFEIQKTLDLSGAKEIRQYGVAKFNEECRKIVQRYTKEWESSVERIGRWVDMTRQYKTMDLNYMESIWWVLKSLYERGLVYEGVKCVPYSWAMNTPLSNFEVNLNYKQVQDPAITLRAALRGNVLQHLGLENISTNYPIYAYVWTTTPWTIPSNMALAVNPEINYSLVLNAGDKEIAIVASDLLAVHFPEVAPKKNKKSEDFVQNYHVLAEIKGEKLLGLEYTPFFDFFEADRANNAFRIYKGDFITAEDGTGIVHLASFGEDDLRVFVEHKIPIADPVDENGCFTDKCPEYQGLMVKDADAKIILDLKARGALVKHGTIEHSYPYCWRTDTPLIYKSISTWFVRVESFREELVENNQQINWVPEHIKDGRFGYWLAGARDWAISRNRFWGTPIPIWKCPNCGQIVCLGSVKDLEEKSGEKISDLHSHFIDHLTWKCEKCSSGQMKRVPEVLDCWFESGSMPYAQWHYPFENKDEFELNFPANFIAEGVDQTRGWFYTLLVLSTALLKRPAFKNVIVNGIVLAEDGKKMSKSLKNYAPPEEVMDKHGADALRLSLLGSPATRADDVRFSEANVKQIVRSTLLPLWNAYNFFVTYALVDNWTPEQSNKTTVNNLLDRWILSKVASLVEAVDYAMTNYRLYAAVPPLLDFVDQLTNWYIRLNRRRFWAGSTAEEIADKFSAYSTLHKVLLTFVRALAPLAPFISEEIFRNLAQGVKNVDPTSVHLNPFPKVEELEGAVIQPELEQAMELFEEIILLGRNIRNAQGLKVRQPLACLTIIYPDAQVIARIKTLDGYIRDELNVKKIEYSMEESKYVSLKAQLNTKLLGGVLGPRLGSDGMAELRKKIEHLTSPEIWNLEKGGSIKFRDLDITLKEILVMRTVNAGIKAAASSGQITVMLDTTVTSELRLEGLAREFVNRVQKLRKESNFEVSDRIIVRYMTACPHISLALDSHRHYVMEEVLAVEMIAAKSENEISPTFSAVEAQEIDGKSIIISLTRPQG
ncbi:MAG: isoleucine--tRNA ligase [Deltaproteobacteria bacterium]|nr:isoleucine--tRNA ligase [Deltaproteobacteria bacterium]